MNLINLIDNQNNRYLGRFKTLYNHIVAFTSRFFHQQVP